MRQLLLSLGMITLALYSGAQTGTVAGFQKISQTTGNLNTTLSNQGMFGYLSETRTSSKIISAAPEEGNGAFYIIDLTSDGSAESTFKVAASDYETFDNVTAARFGISVVDLGDVNSDSKPDYIVSAPGIAETLYLLQSNAEAFDLSTVQVPTQMQNQEELGLYLAPDGDNLLISSSTGAGRIFSCSLSIAEGLELISTVDINHNLLAAKLEDGDRFGAGMSVADMNGDGIDDIICGAPGDDDQDTNFGAVYMLYRDNTGNINGVQKLSRLEGDFGGFMNIDDDFGVSVRAIGDLDENGAVDLAVGAPGDDDGGFDIGSIWILFMREDGTVRDEKKINRFDGNFTGDISQQDRFGTRIATIGDHNDDGTIDLVVGSVLDDDGGQNSGALFTIFVERCPAPGGFFDFQVNGPNVTFIAESGPGYSQIWNFDDGGYSQQINPTHTYQSTGTFWVCLAINNECGGNNYCQNVQVSSVLGLEEQLGKETTVYPNPAYDLISISSERQITEYHLSDITGKLCFSGTSDGRKLKIDLESINQGIYFLELEIEGIRIVKKIQKL